VHYYKRNLGDYAKKAGRLSMLQHGAYTLLIDACYDREQFPTRDEAIDWTWASSTAEVEAVDFVLSKFFALEDGRYVQKRIQEEIAAYHATSETNKRIAAEREARRKEALTKRARSVNEAPPNQEPLTINQEPLEIQEPSVLVPEPSAVGPVAVPADRLAACPTERLIESYHRHLPMLPRVEVINDGRRRALSARWRQVITDKDIAKAADPRHAAIEFFDWYFDHVSRSAFLTGRAKDWRADFDFLTNASKFAKVVEGHYHKETA
jgi:uncharacterized protein YdaU (DUF1376 family)